MTRPLAWALATAFLALGSSGVYADDSEVPAAVPATASVTDGAAADLQMPEFVASHDDLYPAAAAHRMLQGSVGIEFQIDDQGRARVLGQTFVDSPEFADNATAVLTRGRFRVPQDWAQSGGPEQRFVIEVQFAIARGEPCTKRPPHVADMDVVLVCRVQPTRRKTRL